MKSTFWSRRIILVTFLGVLFYAISYFASTTAQDEPTLAAAAPETAEPKVTPRVNLIEFGAVANDHTPDDAAFAHALAALNDGPGSVDVPAGHYLVHELNVPKNVTLIFAKGSALVIPREGKIEINGHIEADLQQIFFGEGNIIGSPQNSFAFPQWFGARADGQHDDTAALQKAADMARIIEGKTLYIPGGNYLFSDTIDLRCNVRSEGVLIRKIALDDSRTDLSTSTFVPRHYPTREATIRFLSDHAETELSAESFIGIAEGDIRIPVYKDISVVDQQNSVRLQPGDILRIQSTDYFKSRKNGKGDGFYTRNDVSQITSTTGEVSPEFAFGYPALPTAAPWNAHTAYNKGDYCTWKGKTFKATWPSGPDSSFTHRHLGKVAIGAVTPQPSQAITRYDFEYKNKTKDNIQVWSRIQTRVWYRPADVPLTVDGLKIKVGLQNPDGKTKRIVTDVVSVQRSHITFNHLSIDVVDRSATLGRLLGISGVVDVTFQDCYFSGATYHGGGYNILASNIANLRLLNCTSINSRKGMDARHAKNVTIDGGIYNRIDSHYGRNYEIRNVTLTSESTYVPGYTTPSADLDAWMMRPSRTIAFNGANLLIENCVIQNPVPGIFSVRSDIGDLYGNITLRDIRIVGNDGDVNLIAHRISKNFDYVHPIQTPENLLIDNVSLENPGRFTIELEAGEKSYGSVSMRQTGPFAEVSGSGKVFHFVDSQFQNVVFKLSRHTQVNFESCTFSGNSRGLSPEAIGHALDNQMEGSATTSFPIQKPIR